MGQADGQPGTLVHGLPTPGTVGMTVEYMDAVCPGGHQGGPPFEATMRAGDVLASLLPPISLLEAAEAAADPLRVRSAADLAPLDGPLHFRQPERPCA